MFTQGHAAALGGRDMKSALEEQLQQTDGFKSHRFPAGIGAGNNKLVVVSAGLNRKRNRTVRMQVKQHRMFGLFQFPLKIFRNFRGNTIKLIGIAGFGLQNV